MGRHPTWLGTSVCALVLSLASCSSSEAGDGDGSDDGADLARFATHDVAELLRAEPGRMDAAQDRADVVAELAERVEDDDLEGEELFHTLLDLGAVDYRPYQEYLDTFEMEFTDPGERPDGSTDVEAPAVAPLNLLVLFDASSSMRGQVDGRPKIELAKQAVEGFISQVPEGAHVSLRAYGHTGSNQQKDKERSCSTTEAVYPLGPFDEDDFSDALDAFEPTGFTPIALAIEEAMQDLPDSDSARNVVYVVSDGEETCGGDPVAAAEALVDTDAEAVVNIIGFDVRDAEQQALRDIADAGNGFYHGADSGDDLRRLMRAQADELRVQWAEWRDRSRTTIATERDTTRTEAAELRDRSRLLATGEADDLRTVADDLEKVVEYDVRALRATIRERSMTIRKHLWEHFTTIRKDVWAEGSELRRDIWEEGTSERRRIYEESRGN
ncbi:VWA domain-containing protein [Aeromicrobium sp. CTD01-1L150]|uniref:VWA domain-containing protein n=1 Tax=Aeromicrobium sp. CTD01-1L150 TaxID=3341830 RepID=UPI0035C0CC8F